MTHDRLCAKEFQLQLREHSTTVLSSLSGPVGPVNPSK